MTLCPGKASGKSLWYIFKSVTHMEDPWHVIPDRRSKVVGDIDVELPIARHQALNQGRTVLLNCTRVFSCTKRTETD